MEFLVWTTSKGSPAHFAEGADDSGRASEGSDARAAERADADNGGREGEYEPANGAPVAGQFWLSTGLNCLLRCEFLMMWIGVPLFCVLLASISVATAQGPEISVVGPAAATRSATAGDRSHGGLRTTVWRGRELTYEVIDGWAVYDGDIVLGRVEEIEAEPASAGTPASGVPGPGLRRDIFSGSWDPGWPDGVIPYEISGDATPRELFRTRMAIAEWNDRTAVQFVPRTAETEYLLLEHKGWGPCRVDVRGGHQLIAFTLDCDYWTTLHELGHAIGLWHEHDRGDRHDYILHSRSRFVRTAVVRESPYDFRSVMHYGGFVSIPPGIAIPSRDLSAGDVAGVNRLYGQPSEATVVTTNPPGLDLVVDGRRVATPATFLWPAGSTHQLEAPLWQVSDDLRQPSVSVPGRVVFGRWSDGGARVHTFVARPGETWVEANFINVEMVNSDHWLHPDAVVFRDPFEGFDATPRALTFISDPGMAQEARVIRLTNRGDAPEQYAMVSDRPWLVATPGQAALAPGDSIDIEVRATRGSLGPELHRGGLTIRPASLNSAQTAEIPEMPVAFAVLPAMVAVQLGASGETVELAVSATEGFVGKDGRPVGRDGRVIAENGDAYILEEGPGGVITARFEPRSQALALPGGGDLVLTQGAEGDWRIGEDRVRSGHRHVADGHEYVLELVDGRWRTATYAAARTVGITRLVADSSEIDRGFIPFGVAVDAEGNLYAAHPEGNATLKTDTGGTTTILAGVWGESGNIGDGGPAAYAQLRYPKGVAVDAAGNVYVADTGNSRVRKIDAAGTITTLAGNEVGLRQPGGVAADAAGNVYVADTWNHRVRKIDAAGTITVLAGTGEEGDGGDGGPAAEAQLRQPECVAVDAAGNVYVADTGNSRVRRIDATGTITTLAGTGLRGSGGDGGPATEARLDQPECVAVDAPGNVYVADTGNSRVRKIDAAGTITTLAGTGLRGSGGDGGPATEAQLNYPRGVAVDAASNVYVADTGNHRVRKIDAAGTITTIADSWNPPDDSPVAIPELVRARALAVDLDGNLYTAESDKHTVRKIDPSGTITILAGTGEQGDGGDGGPATEAQLSHPSGVAVDSAGNVYVADTQNHRVRKIDAAGTITTIAHLEPGPSLDRFKWPRHDATDIAVDATGSVYVGLDLFTSLLEAVRRISPAGTISHWYAAELTNSYLGPMAVNAAGDLFLAEYSDSRGASSTWVHRFDAERGLTPVARVPDGFVESLAAGGPGQLYAAGTVGVYTRQGRIWRIDLHSGRVEVIARWDHRRGSRWLSTDGDWPSMSVAADRSGNVFWNTTGDRQVRVLEPLPQPPRVTVRLPGGGSVLLSKRGDGAGWLLGEEPVESGHVLVREGAGHILAWSDGRWRVVRVRVPLGSSGETAELEVLPDGSLFEKPTGRAIADGSLLTAPNFDTYELSIGPVGLRAALAPQTQTVELGDGETARFTQAPDGTWHAGGMPVEDDGYVIVNGRGYDLEWVQGRWQASFGTRYSIRTVVGTTEAAQGIPASEAILFRPSGLAVDSVGNVFIADTGNRIIRKVDVAGRIWTVAGSGKRGYGGDGGPAIAAQLDSPAALAVDGSGNLYVSDAAMRSVRSIGASSRRIETLLGPSDAEGIYTLAADAEGNVYFESGGYVREIDSATGTVEAVNTEQLPGYVSGLAHDGDNGLYASSSGGLVRIDTLTGAFQVVDEDRGSGALALDAAGKLYWADRWNQYLVRYDAAAGSVEWLQRIIFDVLVDAERALYRAGPEAARDVAVDAAGGVYFSVSDWDRVTRIEDPGRFAATGETLAVFAGAADPSARTGGWEGGPAASARLAGPNAVAVDGVGTLYFGDSNRVWKLDASGTVTVLAGTGEHGYSGDGGPATEAQFAGPTGLAADSAGRVYVADAGNYRVRAIDAAGMITTVAGNGGYTGPLGDGGPATEATITVPRALAVDSAGNLYVAHGRSVRKIDPAGMISTVATLGFYIQDLAVDAGGNVLVTDGRYLYKADAVAGEFVVQAQSQANLLAVDHSGNVYLYSYGDSLVSGRVRVLDPDNPKGPETGVVIAGNGRTGYSGDASRATDAAVSVSDMVVDRSGSIWIADAESRRIRVLHPGTGAN